MIAALSTIGGMFAAALTYLGLKLKNSGRIDTTEAQTLWKEAAEMRTELREQVVELTDLVTSLRTNTTDQQKQIDLLMQQLYTANQKINTMERTHHVEVRELTTRLQKYEPPI